MPKKQVIDSIFKKSFLQKKKKRIKQNGSITVKKVLLKNASILKKPKK